MHLKSVSKLTLLLAFVLLLAVGCAKKPKADDENMVAQTEIQQEEVAEVNEQPITEQVTSQENVVQTGMNMAAAMLKRVNFDYDQYTLSADSQVILKENAASLISTGAQVRIEGHCDARGSDEYNLALGERRALAVKNYLVSLGVPSERMSIISYGEEVPLVMGNTEEAWAQNRRAEFKELN